MGSLVVSTFVALDGVMQAPGATTEGTDADFPWGGWVIPHADKELIDRHVANYGKAGGFLLGRRTFDIFEAHWPSVPVENDPIAAALNGLPKYVVSNSRSESSWASSVFLSGDLTESVTRAKNETEGELQVPGSATLVQSLLAADLVDELRLFIFPIALGTGKRLFGSRTAPAAFTLTGASVTGSGVVCASYIKAVRAQPRWLAPGDHATSGRVRVGGPR
jgi:dihydrofolate reductase